MKNKLLLLLLVVLIMPIGAWADQYFIVNGIMYAADDGTAMMYSGNDDRPAIDPSTEGSVTIPADAEAGDYIVVICRVQDENEAPMTRYAEFVIEVR